jgi:hypothetical protein
MFAAAARRIRTVKIGMMLLSLLSGASRNSYLWFISCQLHSCYYAREGKTPLIISRRKTEIEISLSGLIKFGIRESVPMQGNVAHGCALDNYAVRTPEIRYKINPKVDFESAGIYSLSIVI